MSEFRIGKEIRILSHPLKRAISTICLHSDSVRLTPFQMEVITFIAESNDKVYQKHIEKTFELRKTTVSLGLDSMEKEGFIKRVSVDNDARLKQIVLTQKAIANYEEVVACMDVFENKLMRDISDLDKAVLERCFSQIKKNALQIIDENDQ